MGVKKGSNSRSSDSTLLLALVEKDLNSSGTRSEMNEVSNFDLASVIDELPGIVAQVHIKMDLGINSIALKEDKILIDQDLCKDEAWIHFCFCKVHLQEIADMLWSRSQVLLSGSRGSIKMTNCTISHCCRYPLLLFLY